MDIEKVQGLLRKAIAKTLQIQDDEQATEQIDMLAHDAFEAARDVSYLIADWESKVTADGVTNPFELENKELIKRISELTTEMIVCNKDLADARHLVRVMEEDAKRPWVEDQPGDVELFGGPAHLNGGKMSSIKSTYKIPFRINSDSGLACYELAYDEHGDPRTIESRFVFVWTKNEPLISEKLIPGSDLPF
jgi:hypothetical protein